MIGMQDQLQITQQLLLPIFMTFLIAYPATAPNRNPPPAIKRKSSTGKSKHAMSSQYLYTQEYAFKTSATPEFNLIMDHTLMIAKQQFDVTYIQSVAISADGLAGELESIKFRMDIRFPV